MLRGALVGWLNRTRIWLVLVVAYVVIATWCMGALPSVILPRAAVAAAVWWGTWLSDWLHNLDLKMGNMADAKTEFFFWRLDMLSISVILCVYFLLWTSNIGWAIGTAQACATCLIMLFVAALLFHSGPNVMKHRLALSPLLKMSYVFQFLLMGWLAYMYAFHTHCGFAMSAWFFFLLGFLSFALKGVFGEHHYFGPHEWSHTFMHVGHIVSMALDLYMCVASAPCIAGKVELIY